MKNVLYIIVALWLGQFSAQAADSGEAQAKFGEGIAAYQAGKFAEAHDTFQALDRNHGPQAVFLYNAGNAAFQAGQLAEAALRYREALEISPDLGAARENLATVEATAQVPGYRDSVTILPQVHVNVITSAAVAAGWIVVICVALLIGGRLRGQKRGGVIPAGIAVVALLVTVGLGYVSFQRQTQQRSLRPAIVMKDTAAYSEQSEQTAKLADLKPATSLMVLSRRGDWYYARLPDGNQGWLRVDAVKQVTRPGES